MENKLAWRRKASGLQESTMLSPFAAMYHRATYARKELGKKAPRNRIQSGNGIVNEFELK